MKKILLGTALLLTVGTANAADSIRWNMAGASYHSMSIDNDDKFKPTGFGVFGTSLITENIFLTGKYASVSDDVEYYNSNFEATASSLEVGVGYRHPIALNTDIFGAVKYAFFKSESSYKGYSRSSDTNAQIAEIGIRSLVAPSLELQGAIEYQSNEDDSDTGFGASALYNFTEQFSGSIGYEKFDDTSGFSVSAIFFFL